MLKFLTILMCSFLSYSAHADGAPFNGESEFKVIEVLQGDAGVFTDRTGTKTSYFHLAGCQTFSPDDEVGIQAKNLVSTLIAGKRVQFTFAKASKQLPPASHYLVSIQASNGADVCSELIKKGLARFLTSDEDLLTSVNASLYFVSQSKAKAAKLGMWKNGDHGPAGDFVETPQSRYDLHLDTYRQTYVNGAYNASKNGYDRPTQAPKADTPTPNQDLGDWRKPVYK